MKTKKIIIPFFILAVFAVTVLVFIFTLASEYKSSSNLAESKFSQIAENTAELSYKMPVNSTEFLQSFINSITQNDDIAQIKIEENGNVLYKFPDEAFSNTSSLIKTFTTQIQTADNYITLTASLYLITPFSIFSKARISFFIILIATLFTIIMLIYEYISERPTEFTKSDFSKEEETFTSDNKDDKTESNTVSTESINAVVDEKNELNNIADEAKTDNLELTDNDAIINEDFTDDEETKNVNYDDSNAISENFENESELDFIENGENAEFSEVDENIAFEETAANTEETEFNAESTDASTSLINDDTAIEMMDDMPQSDLFDSASKDEKKHSTDSLFSDVTNLCKESHLITRLDNELIRASSSEQDLTLYILRIPGISFVEPCVKDIAKCLNKYFNFDDMLFEYSTDAFASIQIDESLDDALNTAEKLHSDVLEILKKNNINTTPLIGISARSLRLISAERLLNEANGAVEHAALDTLSPIIAFRVDPERYRKFLAEN